MIHQLYINFISASFFQLHSYNGCGWCFNVQSEVLQCRLLVFHHECYAWQAFDIWLKMHFSPLFVIRTLFSKLLFHLHVKNHILHPLNECYFLNKTLSQSSLCSEWYAHGESFFSTCISMKWKDDRKKALAKIDWILINNFVFEMESLKPSIGLLFIYEP